MTGIIKSILQRVRNIFSGRDEDSAGRLPTNDGIPPSRLDTPEPVPANLESPVELVSTALPPVDLSRWKVSEHSRSPFEKVGRLYLKGDVLVIVSELDRRGFSIGIDDLERVLDGDPAQIYLVNGSGGVGTAKLSASGKGVNFSIDPFLYTKPVRSISRILEREVRKGPLFVGREQVGG